MSLVEAEVAPSVPAVVGVHWSRVKGRLRSAVGPDVYASWFTRMHLEDAQDESVTLSVPTRFLKSWIQAHYAERVLSCWQAERPEVHRINLTVRSFMRCMPVSQESAMKRTANGRDEARATRPANTPEQAAVAAGNHVSGGSPLDPRLTFSTFCVGHSNTFAHAAAQQVAQMGKGDQALFNPLYVHGGVGRGKTHLLQAIAWAAGLNGRTVLYLTAEKFMFGFTAALKAQTGPAFREALRGVDMLVIDDLQFLQGKSSQAESDRMLNALLDSGRQVVAAADRPPSELGKFDERVRSRLLGGLTVELDRFDEALRLAILTTKAEEANARRSGFILPEEVLTYLARTVARSGRELEGALNRLLAHYAYDHAPMTLELVEQKIRDLVQPEESKRIRIEDVQRVVGRQYNISRTDLLSSRRTANIVRPRQIAMYLAKTLTLRSLPEIGRRFGGRDHTTVLHAVNKIGALIQKDAELAGEVEHLKRLLEE